MACTVVQNAERDLGKFPERVEPTPARDDALLDQTRSMAILGGSAAEAVVVG